MYFPFAFCLLIRIFAETNCPIMKRYGILFVMVLLLVVAGCSSLTSAEKAERQAAQQRAVAEALDSRHYRVGVRTMIPTRGMARQVSYGYSVEVKGDTLVSYLPYFGRAYSVPYGGGKGLNFTAPISEYKAEKDNKGRMQITMLVNNEEDNLTYVLLVFDNGQASIDVRAREREPISYSGELTLDE